MAQITIDTLKSFLWSAAENLRGQIDAAGYKEYIFPLLFFKRISDVYDEQYAAFVAEGGEEYAEMQAMELPIRIPDGEHWQDVRQVTENVGQRLVEAFIAIEQANPARENDGRMIGGLEGIFGPKDGWTNKNKMPDHIITSIIEDFSRYNLSLSSCPADEMGQAYEYLVGKFADDAGNTAQEFYTNRTVVELMAEILQPQPDESIYDPTCGSGGMLIKSLDHLRNQGKEWKGVHVFGQEVNGLTSAIARMNLYLNGVEDFSIVCGDTLRNPAFLDGSHLRTFDIVLANPPYSIKEWDRAAFENDKWGRNMYGTPPQARADYAFIQHIVASLNKENGRCAILLPHGVLNRGEEKNMRINHVLADNIDAIIGLGRNLFYNSGLESFIMICNNNKPKERKGNILFIEAEKLTHKEGKQAYLHREDIENIVNAYYNPNDIIGLSKYVTNEDVIKNGGNLNIKSYVKESAEEIENKDAIKELNTNRKCLWDALAKLDDGCINENVLDISSIAKLDQAGWRKVCLADIAEAYSESIKNPSESDFEYFIGSDCIGQYDFRITKRQSSSGITSAQKLFKKGDYLLVRRSLYGSDFRERAPRADFDGICSADIITIRERDNIASGFLIWVLYQKGLWDYIVSNSTGGLTRRIKWKDLANYEFTLPSLSEQKVLADKLWAAYRVKESYKKLLAATNDMLKAKFSEMFGEEDGKEVKLRDLIATNFAGEWGNDDILGNGTQVIKTNNFKNDGTISFDNIVTRNIQVDVLERKRLDRGDILLERSGGTKDNPVGRVVYFDQEGEFVVNNFVQVLRANDLVLSKYLFYNLFIYYHTHKIDIKRMGHQTSGIQNLKLQEFLDRKIVLPPLPLQQQFVEIATQAEATKESLRKSIENIDQVIKSLINQ